MSTSFLSLAWIVRSSIRCSIILIELLSILCALVIASSGTCIPRNVCFFSILSYIVSTTDIAMTWLLLRRSMGRLSTIHPSIKYFSSNTSGERSQGKATDALTASTIGQAVKITFSPVCTSQATIFNGIVQSSIVAFPKMLSNHRVSFFPPNIPVSILPSNSFP